MPTTYEKANGKVRKIIREVMHTYHRPLESVELQVSAVMAYAPKDDAGDPAGPALKLHGYPCAATIQATTLMQRVLGWGDVLLKIDGDGWEELGESSKAALIDHELEHVEIPTTGGGILYLDERSNEVIGVAQCDDLGRPKVKLRKHDWQLGGFKAVAARWQYDALEVQAARAHIDIETGQYCWDFGREKV